MGVEDERVKSSLFIAITKTIKLFAKSKNNSHIHGDKMTYSELIEGKVPSHDDSGKTYSLLKS